MNDYFEKIEEAKKLVKLENYIQGTKKYLPDKIMVNPCPICGHKDHFFIYQETNSYISFSGCCKGGTPIDYLMETEGITIGEAGKKLLELSNISYDTKKRGNNSMKKQSVKKPTDLSKVKINSIFEDEKALSYLLSRGLKKETLKYFKIGVSNKNIVFPFIVNNNITCIKYRIPEKVQKGKLKTWQEKGGKATLFNSDNIDWEKPLIVTEGEIDCMITNQCGFDNVVSIPFGVQNWDWVNFHWEDLKKVPVFIVCGDSDEAGKKFNEEFVKKFGIDRVMTVNNHFKDINVLYFKSGETAVQKLIQTAQYKKIDGLIEISEIEKYQIDRTDLIDTGISSLNRMIGGFLPATLTILSGKRGGGKSTIAGQFIIEAISSGKKCCVYSGELSKELFKHWLMLQIAGNYVELRFNKFRCKHEPFINDSQWEIINDWITNKLFVYDNTVLERKSLEEASILKIFEYAKKRHDCKLFLLDNLMSARSQYDIENNNFYKKQGEFIGTFKKFAIDNNVSVIFVAHPKKTNNNGKFGNDDISGNSEITDRPDNVLLIERIDEEEKQREGLNYDSKLHILKNRIYGEEGSLRLKFYEKSKRFVGYKDNFIDYIDLKNCNKDNKPVFDENIPF